MSRIKLTIEYDGTNFCGWQSQKNGTSVQDVVEQALQNYFGVFIRTYAAGRTDVGVHALGQVVHFDIDKTVNTFKLCLGLNLSLPSSVAVTKAEIVSDDFDARFSAISKTYCYKLYVSPVRRPLFDITHAQVYKPLNVELMKQGANKLIGEHDFKAFQKSGSNLKGTIRTINSFEITQHGEEIEFIVNGNAFLYNQVRYTVGLLVAVGNGDKTLDDIDKALDGERIHAKTMPSKGLTLVKVYY